MSVVGISASLLSGDIQMGKTTTLASTVPPTQGMPIPARTAPVSESPQVPDNHRHRIDGSLSRPFSNVTQSDTDAMNTLATLV